MTVFIESNYVLEIALGQEQSAAADAILRLAEQSTLDLVIPAFALSEPFATVTHRGRARRHLMNQLNAQLNELARSYPHQEDVSRLRPIPALLAQIEKREMDLLTSTVGRLLRVARRVELDTLMFERAMRDQDRFGLSPQDAIIYAAVISELSRLSRDTPHSFISKNWKDFGDPGIRAELSTYGCQFIESFTEGARLLGAE